MKTRELQGMNSAELSKQLEEAHKELFNLRFRLATRQLSNHRELPKVRKTIAQIKTILRQKELAAAYEESNSGSHS
ncbi:MAG: 50S ribosomal protein L29 [Chloroflexota bacterium]|nr:MAG: 50S ribosomal protein L29 [Chloroflexota bacterium]